MRIVVTLIAVLCIPLFAIADQCATKFMPTFADGQAKLLCKSLQAQVNANPNEDTIAAFGYSPSGTYVPLVEMRTRQLLTGFSGTQAGRGAIRFFDTVAGDSMEMGFYGAGAGIFTDAPVFEVWVQDFSVRQLTGSTPAIIELRDISDTKNLAFRNDGTVGQMYTSGFTWPDGAISMRPNANETFLFNGRINAGRGNITQNAFYGGSMIFTNTQTGIFNAVANTLTAAGSTITDALQLTRVINVVTTAAAGTGVKLFEPDTANETPTTKAGVEVVVINRGANDIVLYPPTASDSINGGTVGHGVALTAANDQVGRCIKISTNNWNCTVQNSATVL